MSERKVLKVNNASQDTSMNMPPMDMQPEMANGVGGDFMPQDGMQQPPMDGGMGEMPNQFDTNFDAGVEADEEQDPKKYIQQLTGKLSQSLRKYTDNNGQPDVDLNKYVAGMITKQAMKGLSGEDAEEIIDKVKADEDFSMEDDGGQQDMPQDNQMGGQDMMPQDDMQQGQDMMPQANESFKRFRKNKQIREIVNGVIDKNLEDNTPRQQPHNGGTYRTKPYTTRF